MLISEYHINAYESKKNESIIMGSKCFFLLQLYNESIPTIEGLKEKTSGLGLQLIRFPLFRWRKQSIYALKTADHLPVQISNYALIGPNKLDSPELKTLAHILRENQVVFLFGHQENIWFNTARILENEKLDQESAPKMVLKTMQSHLNNLPPYSVSWPVIRHLLQTLTFISSPLKSLK
jgi:hypothetical protein